MAQRRQYAAAEPDDSSSGDSHGAMLYRRLRPREIGLHGRLGFGMKLSDNDFAAHVNFQDQPELDRQEQQQQ